MSPGTTSRGGTGEEECSDYAVVQVSVEQT